MKKMVTQNDCLLSMLNLDITKLLLCGKAYITERIKYISNNFWKDVLKSWLYFSEKNSELKPNAAMEPLFYNTIFLVGKKPNLQEMV